MTKFYNKIKVCVFKLANKKNVDAGSLQGLI